MNLGKMYEVALVVEGYQSSGKADVYSMSLNIGGSSGTPSGEETETYSPTGCGSQPTQGGCR